MIEEIHLWAGFPCTDLSRVRAFRQGLQGPASSLVFEIPRIEGLVRQTFGHQVLVKRVIENVSSMDKAACEEVSQIFHSWPYELDSVDSVPMRRPRFAWCSEPLEGALKGITFSQHHYWRRVHAEAPYPSDEQWVDPHWERAGTWEDAVLPTCMKAIPRSQPPPQPAGLSRCSEDTVARWESDSYRYPPYQYKPQFLFWQGDAWRLASSAEREKLLGYGAEHTALCLSASQQKQVGARAYEDLRCSLLGDSFSVLSFVVPGAALCRRFLPTLDYQWLANRMGLAPGFRTPLRCSAPISHQLSYGFGLHALGSQLRPQDLNRILLTKVNHTGSDIRVSTGDILNPRAFPRQGAEASWWTWEPVFRCKWGIKEHINSLELRSILLAIRYHIARRSAVSTRIFHLTDSYVCMSIIGKGRSGSKKLTYVLRQLNSLLLGFDSYLVLGHVESSQNPTDEASRR